MYRACIAIVDATRARLFTLERTSDAGGLSEQFSERVDLVNPARRQRPSELFSDTRPGSSRTGGLQYGFDDHRDAHIEQLDAEFARSVIEAIDGMLRAENIHRVIVCASPNMLGELRTAGGVLRREGLALEELPRDLVKLTPPQIRANLAEHGLLPEVPVRPGLAREM